MIQLSNANEDVTEVQVTLTTLSSKYGPLGFANNKVADQPAHLRRLISAFGIRVLESIITELATDTFFNFLGSLWSCEDWFESHFVGNPEDMFCRVKALLH